MRILILANVPPGLIGGAEVQALNLACNWSANGHNVLVAGYANIPSEEENLTILRIRTLRQFRLLRATSYIASTLWLLWRHRKDIDVIYCRFLNEQAFAASVAKILFRLPQPVIACPACASTGGDVSHILRSPFLHVLTWLFKSGLTAINCMSLQIENEILSLGIENVQISRIPNGVTLPAPKQEEHNEKNKVRFLFIGRLAEQKGVDVLLKAASLLKSRQTTFKIDIVGDGPLQQEITNQILELGLADFVKLVGRLPPSKIPENFSKSDVFILPSRYEGMSGALLEAIAHGLPAIVTRVSGSEEIIDDTIGWIVPANDELALAAAMSSAINLGHSGSGEMGSRAQKKAEAEFDVKLIAEKYLELFHHLTDSSHRLNQ